MNELVIDAPGSASLRPATVPTPAPDEVLLRVRTVGFCGSDLNTYRGANPLVSYPRVPGPPRVLPSNSCWFVEIS